MEDNTEKPTQGKYKNEELNVKAMVRNDFEQDFSPNQ